MTINCKIKERKKRKKSDTQRGINKIEIYVSMFILYYQFIFYIADLFWCIAKQI